MPSTKQPTKEYLKYFVVLTLVVLPFVVFWQGLSFEFVYDDINYVVKNERVLAGLNADNVAWAFKTTFFSNWHPFTWLSLMLDVEFFGNNAGGFHFTNLLLHSFNGVLLFAVLRRMTNAFWQSAMVAALFAIHPLHVESVAWVSGRKDLLSTLFGLLAILAYANYVGRRKRLWYLLSLIAFVCSLLSKQMLVTLPCLLLLLDYWPLQRFSRIYENPCRVLPRGKQFLKIETRPSREQYGAICSSDSVKRLLLEKIPFLAISILFCVIIYVTQRNSGAMGDWENFPLSTRCFNALLAYMLYLVDTFWPAGMAVLYPHPGYDISLAAVSASTLLLVMVTVAAILGWRKRPYLLVGWLWYLGTLVPVIGLVQVGIQQRADRYTYVPLVGIFVAISWLVPSLLPAGFWRRTVLPGMAAFVLLALTFVAWRQTAHWSNSVSLYEHTLSVTDNNERAHYNLATTFSNLGQSAKAIEHFRKALRIDPTSAKTHVNIGNALAQLGLYPQAIKHFQEAIRIAPNHANAHYNLGNALLLLHRQKEAAEHFREALRLNSTFEPARKMIETIENRPLKLQKE